MLITENLGYAYDSANTFTFPDLSCNPSETLLILGKSGVGKSTLLHLTAGLMRPTDGKVYVDGKDIYSLSEKDRDTFRGKHIGIIFQRNHFIESLSVLENLLIAQTLAGSRNDKNYCMNLLDRLSISDKAPLKVNRLSQGEQQRVAIARSLVNDTKVILADEPTSALDDDNCQAVVDLLQEQTTINNAALIIVTHDTRLKEIIPSSTTLS